MSLRLLSELGALETRLEPLDRILLFLDFDGTLAPIIPDPDQVELSAGMRRLLMSISSGGRVRVAVISGRSLADVRDRVGIPGLIYAGNHGLEIDCDAVSFRAPGVSRCVPELRALADTLASDLEHLDGARVEDKGLTLSVHYRGASSAVKRETIQRVTSAFRASGSLLRMTAGLEVLEIRPRIAWDKGAAVRWICGHLRCDPKASIYLGDDATDEDAFRALPEAVTIKVGQGDTRAAYRVADPGEVREFLTWLDSRR